MWIKARVCINQQNIQWRKVDIPDNLGPNSGKPFCIILEKIRDIGIGNIFGNSIEKKIQVTLAGKVFC